MRIACKQQSMTMLEYRKPSGRDRRPKLATVKAKAMAEAFHFINLFTFRLSTCISRLDRITISTFIYRLYEFVTLTL